VAGFATEEITMAENPKGIRASTPGDVLELKRRYDNLTDDEIMRLWADQEGLTEIAASILKEEIARRGLRGQEFEARTAELARELQKNHQRFERHQKAYVWKAKIIFEIKKSPAQTDGSPLLGGLFPLSKC
jgi:hypothetical protein